MDDKILIKKRTVYVWRCPECGHKNEPSENPKSHGDYCDMCGHEPDTDDFGDEILEEGKNE